MILRVAIAAVLLLGIHAAASWIQSNYSKAKVASPTFLIEDLPMVLSDWKGTRVDLDDRLFESIGAHSAVSRVYRNAKGEYVSVHLALWSDNEVSTPHHPTLCYENSGWDITSHTKDVVVDRASLQKGRLMLCSRQNERVAAIYWYQVGEHLYFDNSDVRSVKQQLWGHKQRPPLVKVLLQTNLDDPNRAEQRLTDIASQIRNWTATLKPETVHGT